MKTANALKIFLKKIDFAALRKQKACLREVFGTLDKDEAKVAGR